MARILFGAAMTAMRPLTIRELAAQLCWARRRYRALHGNGFSIAKREAMKAECERLYRMLEAMKCR